MDIQHRLAFTTIGCPDWTLQHAVQSAAEMGYAAVEIRGIGPDIDFTRIPDLSPEHEAETKDLLRQCSISLCGLGTSATFHDPAGYEAAVEEGLAAVALCRRMGIPFLRIFGDAFPPEESQAETLRRVVTGMKTLCATAAQSGKVQVLLEVHGQFNSAQILGTLLDAMAGTPSFGLLWDVEHSFFAHGNDIELFYKVVAPHVLHVHVKDCVMQDGKAEPCLPGEGEIDICRAVELLEGGGYGGLYSFEWEKRWLPHLASPEEAFPRYVRYMQAL